MKQSIPSEALNQHIAILGKTGSGKSYAAKGVVEGLLDSKRQVCVLDPTGAWWGLRRAADGKAKGYDVVLIGGQFADIPLAERSGAAVARLVTQQFASVVIDTSGMTVGEYTRWFIDFATTLYTTITEPLHLIIDEAHHFMPQGKSPDVDAGRMLHAGNRLMSGGRSKGVRGMLITQRPAKLHKDSLTCADTLVAMRVLSPQDRGAIKEWIDGAGDPAQAKLVLDSLAQLQRGEGWVWYPEGGSLQRVKFPAIKTYDSSATPKHGAKAGPGVAEIKLDEVRAALADAVAEAEANDPKLLRKRIAELEKAAKGKAAPATVATDPKAIDRAVGQAVAARDKHWQGELRKFEQRDRDFTGRLGKIASLAHLNGQAKMPEIAKPPAESRAQNIPNRIQPPQRVVARNANYSLTTDPDLPKGEQAILAAIVQHGGCDRQQLTVLTGYKRSTRDAYIQRLRERGYVEDGPTITATDEGVAALGDYEQLPTGDALREWWMDRLPEGERRILEVLAQAWPEEVDRDALTEATGYKRSTRDAYLQRMGAKRLIEGERGPVKAADALFDGATA